MGKAWFEVNSLLSVASGPAEGKIGKVMEIDEEDEVVILDTGENKYQDVYFMEIDKGGTNGKE